MLVIPSANWHPRSYGNKQSCFVGLGLGSGLELVLGPGLEPGLRPGLGKGLGPDLGWGLGPSHGPGFGPGPGSGHRIKKGTRNSNKNKSMKVGLTSFFKVEIVIKQ